MSLKHKISLVFVLIIFFFAYLFFFSPDLRKLDDISTPITVSIIGCVVNGPGEAAMTNIGITGGGNDTHMIYVDGKKNNVIKNINLEEYLENLIRKKSKEFEVTK